MSSADDDEDEALPAGDPEADSDDGALAAVLENARKLSGRKAERRERFREDEDEDEDNTEGGAAAAKYSDWFDDPAEGQGAEGDGADGVRVQKGEYSARLHPHHCHAAIRCHVRLGQASQTFLQK